MGNFNHTKRSFGILALAIYCIGLSITALHAYKHPNYNWDMLAYMALAIQTSKGGVKTIHQVTYQAAQAHVPSLAYERLVEGPYRKSMAENPEAFYAALPFYAVKPLYIKMVRLLYKAGFSLPLSTVLPSILFYLLIGLLLYYWVLKYMGSFWALVICLLIMYTGPMVSLAKLSTPDCLSTFLLLSAFYCIVQKPNLAIAACCLLLSLFARLDNIIPSLFILSFLFFANKAPRRLAIKYYLLLASAFLCCYFIITATTMQPFGWNALYYPQFALHLDLSHTANSTFSLAVYMQLVASQLATALNFHHFVFFLLVVLLVLFPASPLQWKRLSFEQALAVVLLLVILVRFVLFPDLSDRFNMAYYLYFLLLLIQKTAMAVSRNKFL